MEFFLDCLLDGLKDGLWSIPVLFIAYVLMEMLERSRRMDENMLRGYSHKAGPLLGGLLGIVPQCGISGAAATLFSTGSITVGTMMAVFFATSDEMLPIMLSSLTDQSIRLGTVVGIVAAKAGVGVVLGYAADFVLKYVIGSSKNIHSFCEREHCSCDEEEGSVLSSAVRHTLKIAVMLISVNVALNLLLGAVGVEHLSGTVLKKPVAGELILGLFGLIPNCSVSVVITESYLNGVVGLGGLFSGLLTNAGIGLLVLFRTNKNLRENLIITCALYILGVAAGIVVTLLGL